MDEILKKIADYGIVPVVKIEKVGDALPLGNALCEGGLPLAEITFRTAAAEEVIRTLTERAPELIVGAGTILTTEQAGAAIRAGASFIVSPGFNPKVVSFCRESGGKFAEPDRSGDGVRPPCAEVLSRGGVGGRRLSEGRRCSL
jgi:2-dehydro-3-deoxyphosphogluconate aldolase/(4S)-4-hydroxy-2-oxoglutarate aldolase